MRNTNNIVSRKLLGILALAAMGVAAPARADVIYNNFGPGDSRSTGAGFVTPVAGVFTTGASGYDTLVFEGAFYTVFSSPPSVTVRLMGDLGGVPDEGTVLATSPALLVTGRWPGASILTWTLDPSVTLAANTTYWFAATPVGGYVGWMLNSTGAQGVAFKSSGNWLSLTTFDSPAFRVSGSVLGAGGNTGGGNGGVVPEPSEWAAMGVLGLALGGLVVRKRRTR